MQLVNILRIDNNRIFQNILTASYYIFKNEEIQYIVSTHKPDYKYQGFLGLLINVHGAGVLVKIGWRKAKKNNTIWKYEQFVYFAEGNILISTRVRSSHLHLL